MKQDLEQALNYALSVVARWAKNKKIHIPELDPDVQDIISCFVPVFQTKGYLGKDEKFIGYEVSEEGAEKIWWASVENPKAVPVILEKIATNLCYEFKMPSSLMLLASGVLDGRRKLARPKAVRPTVTHRDTLLVGIAKRVSNDFRIPIGANKLKFEEGKAPPIVGSTIAAAAMKGFDIHVNPRQAAKICSDKSGLIKDVETIDFLRAGPRGNGNALLAYTNSASLKNPSYSDDEYQLAKNYLSSPV